MAFDRVNIPFPQTQIRLKIRQEHPFGGRILTKDKSNRLLAAIITSWAGKVNNNLKAEIANGRKENRQAIQFHGLAAVAGFSLMDGMVRIG